jgi:uncharacterized membrane protein
LLLALPILIQNLFSNAPDITLSLNYHYTSGLTPFVFISAIMGFAVLTHKWAWFARNQKWLASILLCLTLLRSGSSEYLYLWQSAKGITEHSRLIRQEMAKIPVSASLLTHNSFIPQAAGRKYVYQLEYNQKPTKADQAEQLQADYIVFDQNFWEPGTLSVEKTIKELRQLNYAILFEEEGFYILKKKAE